MNASLSDILIVFKTALDGPAMGQAKTCLMQTGRTVLVHQKEDQDRILLVKFAPDDVTPSGLLSAVRDAGFEASMAGG
ncbi:hypothetical protein ACFL12_02145 [Pseudomonadota bacterium]